MYSEMVQWTDYKHLNNKNLLHKIVAEFIKPQWILDSWSMGVPYPQKAKKFNDINVTL